MFALARHNTADIVELVLVILGLLACGFAVWRATQRDVAGTVLCGVLGIVLLILAF